MNLQAQCIYNIAWFGVDSQNLEFCYRFSFVCDARWYSQCQGQIRHASVLLKMLSTCARHDAGPPVRLSCLPARLEPSSLTMQGS